MVGARPPVGSSKIEAIALDVSTIQPVEPAAAFVAWSAVLLAGLRVQRAAPDGLECIRAAGRERHRASWAGAGDR